MARRVNDRGTVSLTICRGNIRASKGAFQIFRADISTRKCLSSLQVNFERVVYGLGGQKSYRR